VKAQTKSEGLTAVIGPLLRIAAASAAGRAISDAKVAATEASQRAAWLTGAGVAGAIGVFCFSNAALAVLDKYMGPAEAWAALGGFYVVVGVVCYLMRRG
jgi:hypothetical protein